jgi:hypothetical protein
LIVGVGATVVLEEIMNWSQVTKLQERGQVPAKTAEACRTTRVQIEREAAATVTSDTSGLKFLGVFGP